MNKSNLTWCYLPRDELPRYLSGDLSELHYSSRIFESAELARGKIAAGVFNRDRLNTRPSVLVVAENQTSEVLSWLSTYAAEVFPLSQYARVVTEDDWQRFDYNSVVADRRVRVDRWSSVIIGELLAQGEAVNDLSSMPLSRASSCFSMCVARSMLVHGTRPDITRLTVERLRSLEADPRLVRRPLTVSTLVPIWALTNVQFDDHISPKEVVDLIVHSAWRELIKSDPNFPNPSSYLTRFSGLYSDSFEKRVISFNQVADEVVTASTNSFAQLAGVILAAAAFLVGRGTSHVFLLRKFETVPASALAWFGLMSSLAGARSWDLAWLRIAKGIERQLRVNLDWSDTGSADLCWAEYSWLSKTHSGSSIFLGIPKSLSNAVSVEVVPGAACQFRLGALGQTVNEQRVSETRQRPSENEKYLELLLAQFVSLATQVQRVIDPSNKGFQRSLDLEKDLGAPPRPKSRRRE